MRSGFFLRVDGWTGGTVIEGTLRGPRGPKNTGAHISPFNKQRNKQTNEHCREKKPFSFGEETCHRLFATSGRVKILNLNTGLLPLVVWGIGDFPLSQSGNLLEKDCILHTAQAGKYATKKD